MRNKIRQIRLSKGISQAHISKKLGYARASGYGNIEMGRNKLSFEQAVAIAEILGVTVSDLTENDSTSESA